MTEQGVMALEGIHLGPSPDAGKWRLYLTRNFGRYLEFPKAETIRSERVAEGRVIAWVKREARVEEAMAVVAAVPADFLEGGLLDHLRRANEADTIRRLLGLSLVDCNGDKQQPKPEGASNWTDGRPSCPNPQQCSTPGCCKF
ncbi:MAG TPA: hypothetical protein VFX14_23225 [Methylomirabilota bacterium]|nr:hypothetical protein [Methylomirabilota bacterium]